MFLVGIGGAGQRALAEMLLNLGSELSGSDLVITESLQELAGRGVKLFEGHSPANLGNATLVVKTAAARSDNPELQEAERRNLPILTNAQMVALLVNRQRCLSIAGTHGKTTTTNLVASLLAKAGLNPTYFIGGTSLDLGGAGALGQGEYSVVESDEYARRFLEYRPEAAIITNIEPDHLDYYGDFETLVEAFRQFAGKARRLFFCGDDPAAAKLAAEFKQARSTGVFLYGLDGLADWRAADIRPNEQGGHDFTFWQGERVVGRVSLSLPGLHNVKNAVAALALCITVAPQVLPSRFLELVGEVKGTSRRFELKGEINGITVVDDYAHHPAEIAATLAAARARYKERRIVALFQPHTYSRTKALLAEFAGAFAQADRVALMEIYQARETDTLGVSSDSILERMEHPGKICPALSHQNAEQTLSEILQPGDVLLTLGAGDVWKVGRALLAKGN